MATRKEKKRNQVIGILVVVALAYIIINGGGSVFSVSPTEGIITDLKLSKLNIGFLDITFDGNSKSVHILTEGDSVNIADGQSISQSCFLLLAESRITDSGGITLDTDSSEFFNTGPGSYAASANFNTGSLNPGAYNINFVWYCDISIPIASDSAVLIVEELVINNPNPPPTCSENWQCGIWSQCINDFQTRICSDLNLCGTTNDKPSLTQFCQSGACSENWNCGPWSNCVGGKQERICNDLNICGSVETKPVESQICSNNGGGLIEVPSIIVYRLEGNICSSVTILQSEKLDSDYDALDECTTANIQSGVQIQPRVQIQPEEDTSILIDDTFIISTFLIGIAIVIFYVLRREKR